MIERGGGPEVLSVRDIPREEPGPGELRVRVGASGINRVEAKIRADPASRGVPLPAVLGYEAAGWVDALGPGVEGFRLGERVFYAAEFLGTSRGTHAEYHVVRADIVGPAPAGLTLAEAAAVPLAGGTAWEAVVRRLKVRPGETALLLGAAGAVGTFAVQFAQLSGASVVAVAGEGNLEFLRSLGADRAVDYRHEDVVAAVLDATAGRGADVVLDLVGGSSLATAIGAVRDFGRLATVVGISGDYAKFYAKNLSLHGILLTRERERLEEMRPVLESGRLRLPITTYPMEEIRRVHEQLDSGHAHGKSVLTVAEPTGPA